MSAIKRWFVNWVKSPTGPKTTHFWAPAVNYFFPIQGLYDWNKNPETISKEMELVLVCYSGLFMRFAWRVSPRNYLLFSMHILNTLLQGRLYLRRASWEKEYPEKAEAQRLKAIAEKEARKLAAKQLKENSK